MIWIKALRVIRARRRQNGESHRLPKRHSQSREFGDWISGSLASLWIFGPQGLAKPNLFERHRRLPSRPGTQVVRGAP